MKKNISRETEKYISEHPSIKDCLQKGMVNYSALARQISEELGIKKFDAILIACRRYKEKIKNQKSHEKAILEILKNSKIEVKNKIIVVVVEKLRFFDDLSDIQQRIKKEKGIFNLIEGRDSVTIITNSEFLTFIEKKFGHRIININRNMIQINFICPPEIETTSGVITYIYSLFAERGINILEEMSCWTDVLVVIGEKDLARAMEFLNF